MAEVLITLGIIGVVAAMTMPTLISNHKKTVYVNQLKKSYSVVQQGFKKMLADDGVEALEDTEVFSAIVGDRCYVTDSVTSPNCKEFLNKLRKYYNIIDIKTSYQANYKYSWIRKGSTPIYVDSKPHSNLIFLKDGSIITSYKFLKYIESPLQPCDVIKQAGGNACYLMGNLQIDVNGLKRPNVEGRDIFYFNITSDGRLIPYYGKDQAIYISGNLNTYNYWRNDPRGCGNPGVADVETTAQYGSGCAARVIENGWKMDY